jgi:hypothetical protein
VLYLHDDSSLPPDFWSRDARDVLQTVTTSRPGRRVAAKLETIPGGRDVESFVDVVAPDGTSAGVVRQALEELRHEIRSSPVPREMVTFAGVIAEFSVVLGDVASRVARLDELVAAALEVYTGRPGFWWTAQDPLTIEVTSEEGGQCFRLSDAASTRLHRMQEAGVELPATVSIRSDVRDAFERMHGSLYPHVAEWLTGLSRDELLRRGGARFVDRDRVLFVWPSSA